VPLLRTHKPRHAKPSKAAPTLAVGGMTATFGAVMTPAAQAASTATASDFARLRMCESSNNYQANTGNGYYGAYQFELRTWRGLGFTGYPHNASPAVQDAAARELQADRGWQPWPACSRRLGLGSPERASRSAHAVVVSKRPAFTETLTKALVQEKRSDVRAWQAQMRQRGWDIKADGRFGPRSAKVAARFAAEKGLRVKAGTVNKAVYDAAWTLRVT
jgi:methylmalonyl-CoA mutase cobalamin-binding subunit